MEGEGPSGGVQGGGAEGIQDRPFDGLGLAGGDAIGALGIGGDDDVLGHCIYDAEKWGEDCVASATSMIHAADGSDFMGELGAGRGDRREGGVRGGDAGNVQGQDGRADFDE